MSFGAVAALRLSTGSVLRLEQLRGELDGRTTLKWGDRARPQAALSGRVSTPRSAVHIEAHTVAPAAFVHRSNGGRQRLWVKHSQFARFVHASGRRTQ